MASQDRKIRRLREQLDYKKQRAEKKKLATVIKKRVAKVPVDSHTLSEIFKNLSVITTQDGKEYYVNHGVPYDARIVGIYINPVNNILMFHYEHPSFEEVQMGQEIPDVSVEIEHLQLEKPNLEIVKEEENVESTEAAPTESV